MKELIEKFVEESESKLAENFKEGKLFNIFNELSVNTKEVKHSLMLKSLINPKGNHGMGDAFYKLFIESLCLTDKEIWLNNIDNINVYDEYFIGNEGDIKADLKDKYWGRIDLLIENKKAKKAIIIENKIYANDQPLQLIRYNNYAKKAYNNYTLVYLTLDGKEPSFQSYLGNEQGTIEDGAEYQIKLNDIKQVSYSEHILNWLTSCSKVDEINNPVKSIIEQYINNIKELTYKMESINKNLLLGEYKELLTVITSRDIIEVRDEIRKDFFKKLKDKLDAEPLIKSTQFVLNVHQTIDINTVLNSNGHKRNFGIAVVPKEGEDFSIEVQNYGDLIYGFFNNNKIIKEDYDQLEQDGHWLCKVYKIDKDQTYGFYDDRLNYKLLTEMDDIINKLIKNIINNLNIDLK